MSTMHCSLPLVSYQLKNGVLHCTVEGTHGAAVLSRHGGDRPTMYITRIEPLDGEFFCACNFRDPSLVGPSNLKIAGSFEEVHSSLPKWVATYKLKRILFDDPDVYKLFKEPGLTRIMELVPFVKDTQSDFPDVARFEQSAAAAPTRAKVGPVVQQNTSPNYLVWIGIALVVGFFILRSCAG